MIKAMWRGMRSGSSPSETARSFCGSCSCPTSAPVFPPPGMKQDDYRIFPNFIRSLLNKKELHIYGSGKQTRTYCYITDAIEGFLKVISLGKFGEVYNIGNENPEVSIKEVINILKKIDKNIKYKKIDYPESYPDDEPQRRCPDLSKARNHLNYSPNVRLEKGLKYFYSWAKQNYKFK